MQHFVSRSLLGMSASLAGLLTGISIGLIVENLIFRIIARNAVKKWGTRT